MTTVTERNKRIKWGSDSIWGPENSLLNVSRRNIITECLPHVLGTVLGTFHILFHLILLNSNMATFNMANETHIFYIYEKEQINSRT